MYESGFNTEQSGNRSVYQTTYEELFQHASLNCDRNHPTAGPINLKNELPCVEHI